MNRKIKVALLLAALLLISSTALGAGQFNQEAYTDYSFSVGRVTASYLNLRQGPSLDSEVLCVLDKDSEVKVLGQLDDWYVVYSPANDVVGTVHKDFLEASLPVSVTKPEDQDKGQKEETEEANQTEVVRVEVTEQEKELLAFVNEEREKANVALLEFNDKVVSCSRAKAKDMVSNGYFSHESPTYGSPFDSMKSAGVKFKYAGENIAGNTSVEEAFVAMMKDEGSRNNILNPKFTHTGIGIEESEKYGYVIVQQFYGN